MLVTLAICALLAAATVVAETATSDPVVLVFGNSLSASYGLPLKGGWVWRLQHRLTEQGYRHKVVNASISGETTRGGVERLPRALEMHNPAVVVLELGGNDGLRGIRPATIRANLGAMVSMAQAQGARVLLVGVRMPPNYGPIYAEQFRSVFPQVAAEYDVPLLPRLLEGIAGDRDLMQPDGIHPTVRAQERILENIWPQLEPLLR